MLNQSQIICSQIKSILVDVLGLNVEPSQIGDEDSLFAGMLGIDSVAAIKIIVEIEEFFEIKIEEEEIGLALFQNVRSLGKAVEAHLVKQ